MITYFPQHRAFAERALSDPVVVEAVRDLAMQTVEVVVILRWMAENPKGHTNDEICQWAKVHWSKWMHLWPSLGAPSELSPLLIWKEALLKYDVVSSEQVVVAGVKAGNAHEYVFDRLASIYAKMSGWECGCQVDLIAETPALDHRDEERLAYLLRNEAKEILRRLSSGRSPREGDEAAHAPDFTTVTWYGEHYTFSSRQQAIIVEALWKEWEEGRGGLSVRRLRELVQSSAVKFVLSHAFRKHPAFNRMIRQVKRGVYALVPPAEST